MVLSELEQKNIRDLYREQEELRLEHNEMGRRFREKKITEEEWQTYLKTSFKPRSRATSKKINKIRKDLLSNFDFQLQPFTPSNTEYPLQMDTDEKKMHYLLVLTHKLINTAEINMTHPLYLDASSKLGILKEKFKNGR